MSEYRIYMNDDVLLTATDWLPVAVAAWHRATRDTEAGKQGGTVALQKNGRTIATERNVSFAGGRWPDGEEPGLNDLAAALYQLARAAGVDARTLADGMTEQGLPTTRGRVDSIRSKPGLGRSATSAAELIVLCYGAIAAIKRESA